MVNVPPIKTAIGSNWLYCPTPRQEAQMRLFCFPYAGGSPFMFRTWAARLPEHIEIVAVCLPGRNSRVREAAFSEWVSLLEATEAALVPYFDKPFVLFGHSLGALIAYELAQTFQPQYLLISGRRSPHTPERKPPMYSCPGSAFIERLREMNGISSEVLADSKLMTVLEPMIRADIKLAETWKLTERQPLDVPIAAFCGLEDNIDTVEDMQGWERYTRREFSLYTFPGDHFFLHTAEEILLETISNLCNPSST